jgi:hypothetical protein
MEASVTRIPAAKPGFWQRHPNLRKAGKTALWSLPVLMGTSLSLKWAPLPVVFAGYAIATARESLNRDEGLAPNIVAKDILSFLGMATIAFAAPWTQVAFFISVLVTMAVARMRQAAEQKRGG